MNDPEPTTPQYGAGGGTAQLDDGVIAKLKAKLSSSSEKPPLMLSTTQQDRAAMRPRYTKAEWAAERRKRKRANQSRRRNR